MFVTKLHKCLLNYTKVGSIPHDIAFDMHYMVCKAYNMTMLYAFVTIWFDFTNPNKRSIYDI